MAGMSKSSDNPFISHSGLVLPAVGFGTYKLKGREGAQTIGAAINAGYRLIDTAYNYENEGTVGTAISGAASTVAREDLFIASKLPGRYQRCADARVTVEESLFRLGLDYVDMYLIHWPNPSEGYFVEAFKALLDAREDGLIRHVGVCNFLPEHLEALRAATGELPEVNQIELHPYFPQSEALAYHHDHGIVTQAWSPLVRGLALNEPAIQTAAQAHNATASQVTLAWHRQRGALAIPKASSPSRIQENFDSQQVQLAEDELAAITSLGTPVGRMKGQDPAIYEEF